MSLAKENSFHLLTLHMNLPDFPIIAEFIGPPTFVLS
jgi:hypothetical protein